MIELMTALVWQLMTQVRNGPIAERVIVMCHGRW